MFSSPHTSIASLSSYWRGTASLQLILLERSWGSTVEKYELKGFAGIVELNEVELWVGDAIALKTE